MFRVCVGEESKSGVGSRCGMWVVEWMCLCADCASNDFLFVWDAGVGVCEQQRKLHEDEETGHTPSRPG